MHLELQHTTSHTECRKFNYINKSRAWQRAKRNETQRNAVQCKVRQVAGKTAGKLVKMNENEEQEQEQEQAEDTAAAERAQVVAP